MVKNTIHAVNGVSTYVIKFNGSTQLESVDDKTTGLTHIIEHCMCENIKKLEKKFKKYDIRWNAATSNTSMFFYMSGLSKYVRKFIGEFTNCVLNYKITKDVFEREREIILSEYQQEFSSQYEQFANNFYRKFYRLPLAIGMYEDIKNVTYLQLLDFKEKYYEIPSEIIYSHAKNEKDLTLDEIEYVTKFNKIEEFTKEYKFDTDNGLALDLSTKFDTQRIIRFHTLLRFNKNDLAKNIVCLKYLNEILSGGLTSPLYKEIREKLKGCYALFGYSTRLNNTQLAYDVTIFADKAKYDNIIKKLLEIFNNLNKYCTKAEFKDVQTKISNQIKYSDLVSTDTTRFADNVNTDVETIFKNKFVSYDDFLEFVEEFKKAKFYLVNDTFEKITEVTIKK
jgi:predicted Zn-dependent peptidase